MSAFVAPSQQRYLRACMVCSIVQTYARFRDYGCPNCEEFLHLQGSQDQIESCTSQVFEGVISLADPSKSWVAKWQRLDNYVPGMYAIKVSGQLSDETRSMLEEEYRIQYIPRDGSEADVDQ
ncbi:transcription elongation factor spt4 [Amphichorda felina]